MGDQFGLTSSDVNGTRICSLRGELDASTCEGLTELLTGPPGSLVVVDLCQLTFIDSSGLGAIHAARRLAIKDGGNLVLCWPSPMVYRVLEITGFDMWVTDWNPAWSSGPAIGHPPERPGNSPQ